MAMATYAAPISPLASQKRAAEATSDDAIVLSSGDRRRVN
jgi:hypothetical protein